MKRDKTLHREIWLRRCPFCGSKAEIREGGGITLAARQYASAAVACTNADCGVGAATHAPGAQMQERVIRAVQRVWNRRVK